METPTSADKTRKRPPAEVEATHPEKDLRSPMARVVLEEEVEEFFAILKRVHVAVKRCLMERPDLTSQIRKKKKKKKKKK
ncbi:hypothetical protein LINPERHAP1_LOCUS21730 [Linum perenne]